MNVIEKATVYVKSQKDDKYTPSWLDVRESYIQGHKAAYIESVHKQHFRTSEYMPPTEPGKTHNTVWVLSAGELVYYDYNEEVWYNQDGMDMCVELWTWPPALAVKEEQPTDPKYKLWKHIADEHDLELLDGQLWDIIHIVRSLDAGEKTAHQLEQELKQLQYEKLEMEKQFSKVIGTFEELLKNQFVMCELRDFWRKRAGLVQKCEG